MSRFVQPSHPRYAIKDSETSLEITKSISSLQIKLLIASAVFASIFWVATSAMIAYVIILDATLPFRLPSIIYILPVEWLFISVILVFVFLWGFTNKEVIQISNQDIEISLKSRIFNHSRCYLAKDIKDLRVSPYAQKSMAFDYGSRTIRFGQGLDEAEAKQIITAIQKKFPVYLI